MAATSMGVSGIVLRFLFAFALVGLTWNPTRYNYMEWALAQWGIAGRVPVVEQSVGPLVVFSGLVLLAGWIFFVRTATKSLGFLGIVLSGALAATLMWTLFYYGLVNRENTTLLSWIVLLLFSAILGAGMSWAHLRARWSGQATVDDVDSR